MDIYTKLPDAYVYKSEVSSKLSTPQYILTMKIPGITLCLVFVIIQSSCTTMKRGMEEMVKIYYLPFELETFTPVTRQDIEKRANYVFILGIEDPMVVQITEYLSENIEGQFINKVVRMKAEGLSQGTLYVDRDRGIFFSDDESSRKLTSDAFEGLRLAMTRLIEMSK